MSDVDKNEEQTAETEYSGTRLSSAIGSGIKYAIGVAIVYYLAQWLGLVS